MPKYRMRPVEIEARRVPFGDTWPAVPPEIRKLAEWCNGWEGFIFEENHWHISIPTLEGEAKARPGDYIIRGVAGEFYPCKEDIFEQTYEPVEE